MRIIIKETNLTRLKVGSLYIIPYTGGSVGREGDHLILIPDINVSKVKLFSHLVFFSIQVDRFINIDKKKKKNVFQHHAKLLYNESKNLYEIVDLGSRNGTLLNGKRISVAKKESEPFGIVHGSILQFGMTKLLCHVHVGHDTCGHCEPGLLVNETITEHNNVSIKEKHQKELKRLKSKFGVEGDNTQLASSLPIGYYDRAQSRREKIGSSTDHAKTQQSSLNE